MDWREKYRDKIVPTSDEAVRSIKSGELVVFVQAHGEARALINALIRRAPELRRIRLLSHLTFWPADYAEPEYKDSFRVISQFFGKNIRDLHNKELVEHLPLFYYEMPKLYEESWTPDTFLLMVTPPDEHGRCSLGLNSDYAVKCAEIAKKVIVQINPSLPFTHGSYFSLDNAFCIYEEDAPIPEIFMGSMGEIEKKIGENITPLIPDGATLQLGLGGVPDAVLSCLTEKKDLGIHTELFSDGVVDLCNAGVITNKKKTYYPGKMVANFLVGSKKLFEFVHNNPDVLMLPVDITNDPVEIAKNDNMISINSCLQVDLYGQVVADNLYGEQYSGVGGQVDFVRGAKMSKGGKSIITVKSTAKGGTISNIVCSLPKGTLVTTSRFDVHYICSEYGIVNLHGLTNPERAKSLISIAHPDFREQLTQQAKEAGILPSG